MLEVFRRLGSVQFDPLAVAGRSHDLVLHARVADYDPAGATSSTSAARSSRRTTRDSPSSPRASSRGSAGPEPVTARAPRRERRGGRAGARADPRGRPAVVARFRARARGDDRLVRVPTNAVRAVLEAYAVTGVLGLARRDGNRRYYDLIERLLPADVLARDVPLRRAAPAQAPVPVPGARSARRRRRRRHLRGPRACEAGPEMAGLSRPQRAARGARRARRARARRGGGRARQTLRPR